MLQFPAIVYPEITPAEAPVAEAVTAAARSRRPLHVAGAIVVLALGAYGMMSFASRDSSASDRSRGARAAPRSPRRHPQQPAPAAAEPASGETTVKPVVMTQPASSGFAPALEPRASSRPPGAPDSPPAPTVPVKDSSLAPAPVDILLDVPVLPGGDSLITPAARERFGDEEDPPRLERRKGPAVAPLARSVIHPTAASPIMLDYRAA